MVRDKKPPIGARGWPGAGRGARPRRRVRAARAPADGVPRGPARGDFHFGAYFPHPVPPTPPPACRLRVLPLRPPPRRLLEAVKGTGTRGTRRAPRSAGGFGGTSAVKNADVSEAMGDDKIPQRPVHGRGRAVRRRQLVPHTLSAACCAASRAPQPSAAPRRSSRARKKEPLR
ncbi:hypothetical protein LV779_08570 [Streptomyces thinghirensis]|nr:hypothetical protein [Streptomyces thinghirensis]